MSADESEDEASKPTQTKPLNFGKRLAHTDKPVRDRGFKVLKAWLKKHPELERLDYMKLWRGIFYGMWMADKRPVQQELAVNIALLLGDVPRPKQGLWMNTFWETMKVAYEGIDKHRMNKYLLFLRIVFSEYFKALRVGGWDPAEVKGLTTTCLQSVPTRARSGHNVQSIGLLLQLNRILWDELIPQLAEKPAATPEVVMSLLDPFCAIAEGCPIDTLVKGIHEHVLRGSPPEYRAEIVKRLLEGAAKPEIEKKNREALYETVEILEEGQEPPAEEQPRRKRKGPPAPAQKPTGTLAPPKRSKRQRRNEAARRRKEEAAAKPEAGKEDAADASTGDIPWKTKKKQKR